jgi:hypothetical protein
VRMNTASEKELRRRSARGPTLLYDLRFRCNTVRCAAKFGSLLGLHALKTPLPKVGEKFSSTYKWTLECVKSRHCLNLVRDKERRRALGAKLSYYGFDVREAQDAAVQYMGPKPCLSFRLFRSSKRCTDEKVEAAAGACPPNSVLTTTARDRILPS